MYVISNRANLMPGSRTFENEAVRICVSGDLENHRTVYFTDQSPEFRIFVKNKTDNILLTTVPIVLRHSSAGISKRDKTQHRLEIGPCEEKVVTYQPTMLGFQGPAVLGLYGPNPLYYDPVAAEDASEDVIDSMESIGFEIENKENTVLLPKSSGLATIDPLYTFMVYDRDFYKVNFIRTRWSQILSAMLAVLIILVGIIQVI